MTEVERIRDELDSVFETEDHDLQYAAEQTLRDLTTLIDRARVTQA